ncbi:MAG: hypothetical protein C5B43_03080 [Verrucomicrobia bacterium]|nr:MAG: hypothetical protein C5B43_03080 [Verrucomicrobiota bacterium]
MFIKIENKLYSLNCIQYFYATSEDRIGFAFASQDYETFDCDSIAIRDYIFSFLLREIKNKEHFIDLDEYKEFIKSQISKGIVKS